MRSAPFAAYNLSGQAPAQGRSWSGNESLEADAEASTSSRSLLSTYSSRNRSRNPGKKPSAPTLHKTSPQKPLSDGKAVPSGSPTATNGATTSSTTSSTAAAPPKYNRIASGNWDWSDVLNAVPGLGNKHQRAATADGGLIAGRPSKGSPGSDPAARNSSDGRSSQHSSPGAPPNETVSWPLLKLDMSRTLTNKPRSILKRVSGGGLSHQSSLDAARTGSSAVQFPLRPASTGGYQFSPSAAHASSAQDLLSPRSAAIAFVDRTISGEDSLTDPSDRSSLGSFPKRVSFAAGTANEPPVSSAPRMTVRVLDGKQSKPLVNHDALRQGVDVFVERLYEELLTNARLAPFFKGLEAQPLRGHLAKLLVAVLSDTGPACEVARLSEHAGVDLRRSYMWLVVDKGMTERHWRLFVDQFALALEEGDDDRLLSDADKRRATEFMEATAAQGLFRPPEEGELQRLGLGRDGRSARRN